MLCFGVFLGGGVGVCVSCLTVVLRAVVGHVQVVGLGRVLGGEGVDLLHRWRHPKALASVTNLYVT